MKRHYLTVALSLSLLIGGCVGQDVISDIRVEHPCSHPVSVLGSPFAESVETRNVLLGPGFTVTGYVVSEGKRTLIAKADLSGGAFSIWVDDASFVTHLRGDEYGGRRADIELPPSVCMAADG